MLDRTPLFDVHSRGGAKMVPFAGWEMPLQYSGVIAEHRAVRTRAGLFDVSHMGEVEVTGPQASAFLQRVTPNDVDRLAPGRAHYSALLSERGTMLDDLLVYRLAEDRFLLVVNAGPRAGDVAWLEELAPRSGVSIVDRSDETALLALQGPASADILSSLVSLDLTSLRYYRFVETKVAGEDAILSRTGYTGEDGFEIYVAPDAAEPIWERLVTTGSPFGLLPAGLAARDTLRLEAGMLLSGQDFDQEATPFEVGVGWMVKLGKGDFVGRQALLRQADEGLRHLLIGFEITGRGIARRGSRVSGHGCQGAVTSGGWSPTLERAIGLALVEPPPDSTAAEWTVEVRGRELQALRVDLPFYKRQR